MFKIIRATVSHIPEMETLYKDVTAYFISIGKKQWEVNDVSWKELSKLYNIEDFYLGYQDDELAVVCCIVDIDNFFWPEIPAGTSLFLHKLCVSRKYKGLGYADKMLDFYKEYGKDKGYSMIRLDCRSNKPDLIRLYERNDFKIVSTCRKLKDTDTCKFIYEIKE